MSDAANSTAADKIRENPRTPAPFLFVWCGLSFDYWQLESGGMFRVVVDRDVRDSRVLG
jgi:hypothetical protein